MICKLVKIELHMSYFLALHMGNDVVIHLEGDLPSFFVYKDVISAVRHLMLIPELSRSAKRVRLERIVSCRKYPEP